MLSWIFVIGKLLTVVSTAIPLVWSVGTVTDNVDGTVGHKVDKNLITILTEGYGGWQAFDATAQERSQQHQNVYACGPCPVKAIKEGNLYIPYDGMFIFTEVNTNLGATTCTFFLTDQPTMVVRFRRS